VHEAEVALLDQVGERHAAAVVPASHRHDEAQVGPHELVAQVHRVAVRLADVVDVRAGFLGRRVVHHVSSVASAAWRARYSSRTTASI
jgi:hypothetical protein